MVKKLLQRTLGIIKKENHKEVEDNEEQKMK